jgi:hypothetical protein
VSLPVARLALALALIVGCSAESPSMIPIDVSAAAELLDAAAPVRLRQVMVAVKRDDQPIQSGTFDWAGASADGVLRVAVLLGPEISGEVVLEVHGMTTERPTRLHSHRLPVTPGQVSPVVRIVLLPP